MTLSYFNITLRIYLLEVSCLGWVAVALLMVLLLPLLPVAIGCTVCTGVLFGCVSKGCIVKSVGGFTGGAELPDEFPHPPFMSCKQTPHINQLHFTAMAKAGGLAVVWWLQLRWATDVNWSTTCLHALHQIPQINVFIN